MKTKKISALLAIIVSAGMILTGSATAGPEMLILEIKASGKGYEAVSDDGIVYTESKHKLDKFLLYAHCNRGNGEMTLAFYNTVSGIWAETPPQNMVETEKNLLINLPFLTTIYHDSIGYYYSSGTLRVKIKLQEGRAKSAKLKSLALSYWQSGQYGATGSMQRFGAVKMKGKMIDWDEVPTEVQGLFD